MGAIRPARVEVRSRQAAGVVSWNRACTAARSGPSSSPTTETLWGQIRLIAGSFMHELFMQGAFQGSTPQEAYFVKCDSENNTQSSIDQGIVTITVGFAPLLPAEFIVIQIEQLAGQSQVGRRRTPSCRRQRRSNLRSSISRA